MRTCIFSGGSSCNQSAKRARNSMIPKITAPVMNNRCLSNRRHIAGGRVPSFTLSMPGRGRAAPAAVPAVVPAAATAVPSGTAILDPRIDDCIQHVDEHVQQNKHRCGDEQTALDQWIVAAEHCV